MGYASLEKLIFLEILAKLFDPNMVIFFCIWSKNSESLAYFFQENVSLNR